MARPNLFNIGTWGILEQFAIEVLTEGLKLLAKKSPLPQQEDPLNRRLLTCCRKALHILRRAGRGVPCNIMYEANNQPIANDSLRASRLGKRPDFTVDMHDPLEANVQSAYLFFTIECKRLGLAVGGWVLNRNYTTNGVQRFRNVAWGYGRGYPSGAMVGYVQSMPLDDVLTDVNYYGGVAGSGAITRSTAWAVRGVTQLDGQLVIRSYRVTPFTIHHVWLDIAHKQFVSVSTGKKRKTLTKRKPKTSPRKPRKPTV